MGKIIAKRELRMHCVYTDKKKITLFLLIKQIRVLSLNLKKRTKITLTLEKCAFSINSYL